MEVHYRRPYFRYRKKTRMFTRVYLVSKPSSPRRTLGKLGNDYIPAKLLACHKANRRGRGFKQHIIPNRRPFCGVFYRSHYNHKWRGRGG
ncbi:hypothetical protein M407DRAFT_192012 [Tulasnella calospora MUT 4182]|uniref:Uncharacterized protein n=1 Tax=Tulasnella calospora MUT 4182 TaxID=1051891 RepID=A0A0C3LHH5_9AGAM|nr:hypothetical protein M407DRAFT_192012 [Tulasnella calospora MUT 4182]